MRGTLKGLKKHSQTFMPFEHNFHNKMRIIKIISLASCSSLLIHNMSNSPSHCEIMLNDNLKLIKYQHFCGIFYLFLTLPKMPTKLNNFHTKRACMINNIHRQTKTIWSSVKKVNFMLIVIPHTDETTTRPALITKEQTLTNNTQSRFLCEMK